MLRTIRRPLIAVLAVAIVAFGHASVMLQMLGATHRHDPAPAAALHGLAGTLDEMLHELRHWKADLQGRLLPVEAQALDRLSGAEHGHAHAHAGYERHHHEPGDLTVVAIDGIDGGAAETASQTGSVTGGLPLAMSVRWELPAPCARLQPWPTALADRWQDAALRPAERPPRA